MKIRTILSTAVAVVGFAAMAVPTFAVTFASFPAVAGHPFTFTNNSTSPNNLKLTANVPVTFQFLVPNLYGAPNTPIAAQLVLTAVATSPQSGTLPNIDQTFSSVSMTFTAIGGPHPGSNLLTLVSTSTGDLTGKVGGSKASFGGDTGTGDTVDFTSDFLFFNSTTTRDYDIELTTVFPTLGIGSHTSGNHQTTGFPKTFTATGGGSFDSNPAPNIGVPEPSPAIALLLGGAGLALLFVRNRKIATARPMAA
jgi:hypothetical protein